MAQVSVIGLGAMGSTLATRAAGPRARGDGVEPQRVGAGGGGGRRPARGVRPRRPRPPSAAPLTLMCVTDYPAADEVLRAPGVLDELAGRAFVQLTNGSEAQVRAQMARVEAAGGRMLAGGILGYPRHIGRRRRSSCTRATPAAFDEHGATSGGARRGAALLGEDPARRTRCTSRRSASTSPRWAGFWRRRRWPRARVRPVARVRRRHARHGGAAARPHRRCGAADRGGRLCRRPGDGGHPPDGSARRQRTFAGLGLQCWHDRRLRRVLPPGAAGRRGRRGHRRLFKRIGPAPRLASGGSRRLSGSGSDGPGRGRPRVRSGRPEDVDTPALHSAAARRHCPEMQTHRAYVLRGAESAPGSSG